MISNVFILGRAGKILENDLRLIEVERPSFEAQKMIIDYLPAKYWTKKPNNHFMKIPSESYVALKGRLENDLKYGVIIIIEQVNTLFRGSFKEDKN